MAHQILRRHEVLNKLGIKDTLLKKMIKNGTFPKPILIGGEDSKATGWIESEIDAWIDQKSIERDCDSKTLLQYFEMERRENNIFLQMISIYERNDSYLGLPESDRSRLSHLKSLSTASESRNPPGYEESPDLVDGLIGGAE